MVGSTIYAAQKAREAVNTLVLGDGPLRERLSRAVFDSLHILTADEIPDADLQGKLEAIVAETEDGAKPDDRTLAHLQDDQVRDLARRIVELFEACIRLYTLHPAATASE